AKKELDEKGTITFAAGDTEISLGVEDLLIETVQKEGYHAESGNGVTVVLDTNLTDELIEEGFVRELISKIQTMRKDAGFEVMDTIKIYVSGNEKIEAIFASNTDEIKHDVLATDVIASAGGSYTKDWDINGEKVTLGVEKN
ncbi:MAG: isoleucine--tRNA ligase, partial [Clostridia bacterium]|nr:isoleucine--tRNA ligase [Clostridia bacterium]